MTDYFPDTNFFFECRSASDLPWHELSGSNQGEGPDIRLLIPPTVITEIERRKNKDNSRASKRAREASARLREALKSENHQIELRASEPRIVLELPPVIRIDWSKFPNLDPGRPDHCIAAEYATLLGQGHELVVLTDDTLLALAVRSLGHGPVLIPESWKLPPEKDDRDDQNDKLREELKLYKRTFPEVSVNIRNSIGDDVASLEADVEKYEPSPEEFEQALAYVQARAPVVTNFQVSPLASDHLAAIGVGSYWRRPTEQDIETYKSETYPRWIDAVHDKLPKSASALTYASHQVPFSVQIDNIGFVNATGVRLTISSFDGIALLGGTGGDDGKWQQEKILIPTPPKAPRGHFVSMGDILRGGTRDYVGPAISAFRPQPKDANRFYYTETKPSFPVEELELECEALPHRIDPIILSFRAVIPVDGFGKQPRLRVRLRASNIREPIEKYVRVSARVVPGEFLPKIKTLKYGD